MEPTKVSNGWHPRLHRAELECPQVEQLSKASGGPRIGPRSPLLDSCASGTKLQLVDDSVVSATLGQQFIDGYVALPVYGTLGGIILACSQDIYSLNHVDVRKYLVTATIQRRMDNSTWSLMAVYGPHGDTKKREFLQELRAVKTTTNNKWLVLGDFNLIYRACDKSNGRVNRGLMRSFRTVLNELELRELHLHGKRFTWTSGTVDATQTKIDHFFSTR
jgi:hypothetical protein